MHSRGPLGYAEDSLLITADHFTAVVWFSILSGFSSMSIVIIVNK